VDKRGIKITLWKSVNGKMDYKKEYLKLKEQMQTKEEILIDIAKLFNEKAHEKKTYGTHKYEALYLFYDRLNILTKEMLLELKVKIERRCKK